MAESPSIDLVTRRFMAGIQHAEGDGELTLTVGTEAADVIAVTVAGAEASGQYVATIYDSAMLLGLVGAWTMAETGAGAEVSTTAKPRLLFTASATGTATLSVTDVAGASGLTVYLEVRPAGALTAAEGRGSALAPLTFD
jgi:hypothetical protein